MWVSGVIGDRPADCEVSTMLSSVSQRHPTAAQGGPCRWWQSYIEEEGNIQRERERNTGGE